jgi:hypothetical protein
MYPEPLGHIKKNWRTLIVERRAEVAPDSLLVAPPTIGRIGVAAVFTVSFTYKFKYIILTIKFHY